MAVFSEIFYQTTSETRIFQKSGKTWKIGLSLIIWINIYCRLKCVDSVSRKIEFRGKENWVQVKMRYATCIVLSSWVLYGVNTKQCFNQRDKNNFATTHKLNHRNNLQEWIEMKWNSELSKVFNLELRQFSRRLISSKDRKNNCF